MPNLSLISSTTEPEQKPQQTQQDAPRPTIKPTAAQMVEALIDLLAADGMTQIERVTIDVAPVVSSLMLADPVTGQSRPVVTGRKGMLALMFHESSAPRDVHKYRLAVERLRRYGIEGQEQPRV